MRRAKPVILLLLAASLGGLIAWMFKSSQDEIDKIRNTKAQVRSNVVWIKKIFHAGKTPVATGQLTNDDIEDLIVSSGKLGAGQGPKIQALNGTTGKILWSRRFSFAITHEPVLMDINQDQIDDVLVSGNSDNIYALDGTTGEVIWDLIQMNPDVVVSGKGNFSHIAMIHDLNNSETPDFFVSQSFTTVGTLTWLYKINAQSGIITKTQQSSSNYSVTAAPSIVVTEQSKHVILPIKTLKKNSKVKGGLLSLDLNTFEKRWDYSFEQPGTVHRPVTLLHNSTTFESAVFAVNEQSTIVKLNAHSGNLIWVRKHDDLQTFSGLSLGQFSDDQVIDVVLQVTRKEKSVFKNGNLLRVNGKTGELIDENTFALYAKSSPLTIDFNNDGYDEVLVFANLSTEEKASSPSAFAIFDGKEGSLTHEISLTGFAASTPTLKDIDQDGSLDLLFNIQGQVFRLELKHAKAAKPRWLRQHGAFNNGSM